MGQLISSINHKGLEVNNIFLGEPIITGTEKKPKYLWDDNRLPNGTIDKNGKIVLDKEVIE